MQSVYSAKILPAKWLVRAEYFDRWVNVLADNDNNPPSDSAIAPADEPAGSGLLSFY
jgi:hypothetical protein